jgi:hypothetical protein
LRIEKQKAGRKQKNFPGYFVANGRPLSYVGVSPKATLVYLLFEHNVSDQDATISLSFMKFFFTNLREINVHLLFFQRLESHSNFFIVPFSSLDGKNDKSQNKFIFTFMKYLSRKKTRVYLRSSNKTLEINFLTKVR